MRGGVLSVGLAAVQGIYYFLTGLWPIVHIDSFLAVTGPKSDLWLVRLFGALIAAIAIVLLDAARRRRVTRETAVLAIACIVVLTAGDVYYVMTGTLSAVYLLDAAVEVVLLLGWGAALLSRRRGFRNGRRARRQAPPAAVE